MQRAKKKICRELRKKLFSELRKRLLSGPKKLAKKKYAASEEKLCSEQRKQYAETPGFYVYLP